MSDASVLFQDILFQSSPDERLRRMQLIQARPATVAHDARILLVCPQEGNSNAEILDMTGRVQMWSQRSF